MCPYSNPMITRPALASKLEEREGGNEKRRAEGGWRKVGGGDRWAVKIREDDIHCVKSKGLADIEDYVKTVGLDPRLSSPSFHALFPLYSISFISDIASYDDFDTLPKMENKHCYFNTAFTFRTVITICLSRPRMSPFSIKISEFSMSL